jgi:methyl-accepting chemotaxis protein
MKEIVEHIQSLQSYNHEIQDLQHLTLEQTTLKQQISQAMSTIQEIQNHAHGFADMVTQSFKLCDCLQSPLNLTTLYDSTHALEVEVAQQK